MVGREFAEGTVTNLFAVPVGRGLVVAAKLAVYGVASLLVAVALPATVVGVGLLLGFGWPDEGQAMALVRLVGLVVLSGLVALPCAWAASVGRGLLPGIGLAVGVLVATQVAVVAGAGAWFPASAPALWALQQGQVDARAFLGLLALSAVAAALTIRVWTRLQLDR
jgi:ABC-2 type transport system permease protein